MAPRSCHSPARPRWADPPTLQPAIECPRTPERDRPLPTKLFDLKGRVALITGASRGIGEATARLLAEQGAHVVLSSRKQADLDAVAASIIADGGEASAIAAHQGDSDALAQLISAIDQRFGRLDILVNNAATNPHFGHISDTPMAMVE